MWNMDSTLLKFYKNIELYDLSLINVYDVLFNTFIYYSFLFLMLKIMQYSK